MLNRVHKDGWGKLFLTTLLFSCLVLGVTYHVAAAPQTVRPKVAVSQIVEHSALNSVREGVLDALKKAGIDAEIMFEVAQGSVPISVQIAQKFSSWKPQVVIAISTPTAQTMVKNIQGVPVVFAAVSDPEAAGLTLPNVKDFVTGVIDQPSVETQLTFFREVFPNIKKLGVIFNSGEANSSSFLAKLKPLCAHLNITLKEASITKTSDVSSAMKSLIADVDAIILPQDNTVISALDAVVAIAHTGQVPLLSSDTDLVKKGICAAIGFNHYETGQEAGQMAVAILKGQPVSQFKIHTPQKMEKLINKGLLKTHKAALEKLGLSPVYSQEKPPAGVVLVE